MAGAIVLHDFTSGKRTVRGEPNPGLRTHETVIAVTADAMDDVLGTRTAAERTRVLRRLRDDGLLVCRPGRLTHKVRGGNPPLPARPVRAYVFAAPHPDYVRLAAEHIRRERG